MAEFLLFRIKVLPNDQGRLDFGDGRARSEILRDIIESSPKREFYSGRMWHLGNVERVGNDGLYLRIGRTVRTTKAVYEGGSFLDKEEDTAPYTHIFINIPEEVCAVATKPALSPNTISIAKRFARLLMEDTRAQELNATLEIDSLNDPTKFLEYIQSATSISRFSVTLSRPNPFDTEELFVKPLESAVEASHSENVRATFLGVALDANWVENVTRSAAALGEQAEATLKSQGSPRKIRKRLKGDMVTLSENDISTHPEKVAFLDRVVAKYNEIRYGKIIRE